MPNPIGRFLPVWRRSILERVNTPGVLPMHRSPVLLGGTRVWTGMDVNLQREWSMMEAARRGSGLSALAIDLEAQRP